ncbi:hypothetical protein BH09PSE5_BH09PSE5_14730 [soil metagenome]
MNRFPSSEPRRIGTTRTWLLPLLLTYVAYAIAGRLALTLAIPPGFASPLYPATGIALACVLVYGKRMLIAVAIAAFHVNLYLSGERGNESVWAWLMPAMVGAGAALQAWAGAALIKHFVRQPLTLSEPRDIGRFFILGAFIACLVNSSVSVAGLSLRGTVPPSEAIFTWWTWWIGDTLGVLIGAPIALTLIGRPREDWMPRRLIVGAPLALATVLMGAAISQVARSDDQYVKTVFEQDANAATNTLMTRLNDPLQALEAVHGLFIASDEVTAREMKLASGAWLKLSISLQAIGWSEMMRRDQVPGFETRVRSQGMPGYKVFEFPSRGVPSLRLPQDEVITNRFIEPREGNENVIGLNHLSVDASRAAIDTARREGKAIASTGFKLVQERGDQTGIVIYKAVYDGEPRTPQQRLASTRGIVFVTLRMQDAVTSALGSVAPYLKVCVIENAALAPQRLSGTPGCEKRVPGQLRLATELTFAGQPWIVQVSADRGEVPNARRWSAWLFSLTGLVAIAMLGALLLTVTGRTRRIEVAVRERTAELMREIAEREHTEAALRDSEQRFRNIFNNVPIGVVYTDLQGQVKQCNPKFCSLVGYGAETLASMAALDFTHPEDRAQEVMLTERLVSGDIPSYRLRKRYLAKDGRTLNVQSVVSLLRDAEGMPHRIVAVVEDITEHLRLQDAEMARESAEAANQAKSEFLSRMSHELRTPLNAMLGFAQLLELDERQPLPPNQRRWARQIKQAGWHLLDMINDVLDLSRIESGTLKLQTEVLDVTELLTAAVALVEPQAQSRGIKISREIAPGTSAALGDGTRVKQILTNLLSNAVKYNIDGGRIHIATRIADGGNLDIAITDTGLGMTPQQMRCLFEPFNRLGRERSSQEGTGIGLVISQRLAEMMGGGLQARSTEGAGSSFIVTLPLVTDPDTLPSNLDELLTEPMGYHHRVVHYVEDNETNAEVMRGILGRRPQISLEVSSTGTAGLSAITRTLPDLILLDMHLPDMSGMEVLQHLKSDKATADIPVVIVSADALKATAEAALAAGAKRYLSKPVSVSELLAVVDQLLVTLHTR